MLVTNSFTCSFATIYAIKTYLSLEITSIIKTCSAIISTLRFKNSCSLFFNKVVKINYVSIVCKSATYNIIKHRLNILINFY